MTDPMMALLDYMRKQELSLDRDFLQDAVRAFAQMLIELEVSQQIGAKQYERIESRTNQRNGYRERTWETRVGNIPLQILKLRKGSYFPSRLEPRLLELMAAAGLVIARGGYNTVQELRLLGTPAICVPARRGLESQRARIRRATQETAHIQLAALSPSALARAIRDTAATPSARRHSGCQQVRLGNQPIAANILNLCIQRDNLYLGA